MKKSDLIKIGQRYNMLTVYEYSHKNRDVHEWLCICDCGGLGIFTCYNLLNGNAKSCSCLRYFKKHGGCTIDSNIEVKKTYKIWTSMKQRCRNPKNIFYKYYGGRGIKVCKRWNIFENFLKDMGVKKNGMTLDRINNNGNYEPNNCRWASRKDQSRNIRTNVFVKINGESKTISEWSEISGIHRNTLLGRLRSKRFDLTNFLVKPLRE